MEKRTVILAIGAMILSAAGCSPFQAETQMESDGGQTVTTINGETQTVEDDGGTEGAVSDAMTMISVPMGTYYNGEQQQYCTVDMPERYTFMACFTGEDNMEHAVIETGNITLAEAAQEGLLENREEYFSYVQLTSEDDSEVLGFRLYTPDLYSMDLLKEEFPDGTDMGTDQVPAYYYVDESEYAVSDLCLALQMRDSVIMLISYEGPLADEIGLEHLAEQLYDRVTVAAE